MTQRGGLVTYTAHIGEAECKMLGHHEALLDHPGWSNDTNEWSVKE